MAQLDYAQVTADLTQDEGVKLFVYDDATGKFIRPGTLVVGHPSIGCGRALDTHGIRASESACMLANDIPEFDAQLLAALPWVSGLDEPRHLVLAEMAFNMGIGNGATGLTSFTQMLAAVQRGNWAQAQANMVSSRWYTQVGDRRAGRLASIMLNGG